MEPPDDSEDTRTVATSDTLADTDPAADRRAARPSLPGYEVGPRIGEGGMGEIVLGRDPKIGRDVAIKRMRASAPTADAVDRFLREAKIQARLEHPSIVPVHDLGHDAEGRPYFTMKRLAGTTLQDILRASATSLASLLRAFVDVCLAIDFAHARSVVHRDLKPANIVIGEYGEVYVLDWGVARVIGGDEDGATPRARTQDGALLGTPGYMAPEQVRGELDVGPAADVYALGSILFEILTGEPLHPRGVAALAATLTAPTQAPTSRNVTAAIAPELDAACLAALAEEPTARPTARSLADRVQQFLDGDRDLERRRVLAAEQLLLATVAAADPARRADAMRIAGRALALDPESKPAAALVSRLMLEPPETLPPELGRRLVELDDAAAVRSARTAARGLMAYFAGVPFLVWAGVTDWPMFAAIYATVGVTVCLALYQATRRRTNDFLPLVLNWFLIVGLSRLFGPFVVVPTVIASVMIVLGSRPQLIERGWLVAGAALSAWLVPIALEAVGRFGPTWAVVDGKLVVSSRLIELESTPTAVVLILWHVLMIVVVSLVGRSAAVTRRDAQRKLEIQAWHLRQLLP